MGAMLCRRGHPVGFVYGPQRPGATLQCLRPDRLAKQTLPARVGRVIIASSLALNIPGRERVRHMPSLVRFLVAVGVLGGVVYGGLYLMAVFFEPEPREISTTVQGVRIPR
jgi:hypothetical protein